MEIKDLMEALKLLQTIQGGGSVEENPKEGGCTGGADIIGRRVIVRCRDAGVHFGTLVDYKGREVNLSNSRRMWYWKCKEGHTLSGCAAKGIHSDSKISAALESVFLLEACEILLCSEEGAESISGAAIHNA